MGEPQPLNRPTVTARALVEYQGKFLMIYAPWCERWTLPGGRVEGTESIEQTIVRELEEEIGIKPAEVRYVGFGQGAQYGLSIKCAPPKLHMICHVRISQKPRIDENEAKASKWVTLSQMRDMTEKEDGIDDFFRRFPDILRLQP